MDCSSKTDETKTEASRIDVITGRAQVLNIFINVHTNHGETDLMRAFIPLRGVCSSLKRRIDRILEKRCREFLLKFASHFFSACSSVIREQLGIPFTSSYLQTEDLFSALISNGKHMGIADDSAIGRTWHFQQSAWANIFALYGRTPGAIVGLRAFAGVRRFEDRVSELKIKQRRSRARLVHIGVTPSLITIGYVRQFLFTTNAKADLLSPYILRLIGPDLHERAWMVRRRALRVNNQYFVDETFVTNPYWTPNSVQFGWRDQRAMRRYRCRGDPRRYREQALESLPQTFAFTTCEEFIEQFEHAQSRFFDAHPKAAMWLA